jgi:hypothetical protein
MINLFGLISRVTNHATKTSKKDTDRDFKVGSGRNGVRRPVTAAQKAFYKRLKRLAPKSRRKRLHRGPF